jgi:hypothetical protein
VSAWEILGWAALVLVALAWVGGVWEIWSATRRDARLSPARKAVAYGTALLWPIVLGALVIRVVEEKA